MGRLSAVFVIAWFVVGCGGSEKKPSEGPDLPCNRADYPCAFSKVEPETNARTIELTEAVFQKGRAGANWKSALEWIRNQPEVVEATGSASGIRFRLEGGRPAWAIFRTGTMFSGSGSSNGNGDRGTTSTKQSPLVVGEDRKPREPKKALVLTPDPELAGKIGKRVAKTLRSTRGYERSNAVVEVPSSGAQPKLDHFKRWGDYDFVFFTTHGICGGKDCEHVALSTGIRLTESFDFIWSRWRTDNCESMELADWQREWNANKAGNRLEKAKAKLNSRSEPGLGISKIAERCATLEEGNGEKKYRECSGHYAFTVGAEFLEAHSGATDDMLVVGNGCETFSKGSSDLADVFSGKTTAFVGWSNTVTASGNNPVMPSLVETMSERGITAWSAIERLRRNGEATAPALDQKAQKDYCDIDLSPAKLVHSVGSEVVRLREVVELDGPGGVPLDDGTDITGMLQGIAGDGNEDALDVVVYVDGIDVSPAGNNADEFEVELLWNGEQIGPMFPVDRHGTTSSKFPHFYELALEDVPLGADVSQSENYELEAVAHLPEGGVSSDSAEALFARACWGMFDAGPVSWDSAAAGSDEQFGGAQRSEEELYVFIGPSSGKPPVLLNATVEHPWTGPGDYPVDLSVSGESRSYSSPVENNQAVLGNLHVSEVVKSRYGKLIRGTFKGEIAPTTDRRDGPRYPVQGRFSLPLKVVNLSSNQPTVMPSVWAACSGAEESN